MIVCELNEDPAPSPLYPSCRMVSWGLNSRSQPNARKALGSSSKTHTIVSRYFSVVFVSQFFALSFVSCVQLLAHPI